jgi:hypothetical protein
LLQNILKKNNVASRYPGKTITFSSRYPEKITITSRYPGNKLLLLQDMKKITFASRYPGKTITFA